MFSPGGGIAFPGQGTGGGGWWMPHPSASKGSAGNLAAAEHDRAAARRGLGDFSTSVLTGVRFASPFAPALRVEPLPSPPFSGCVLGGAGGGPSLLGTKMSGGSEASPPRHKPCSLRGSSPGREQEVWEQPAGGGEPPYPDPAGRRQIRSLSARWRKITAGKETQPAASPRPPKGER